MIVGVLKMDLAFFEARSLKDKRQVLRSVKQRLRNVFNVSVSEVGFCDSPKRSSLGVAMIAKESRPLQSQLDKIVDQVRRAPGLTLVDYHSEYL